MPTKNQAKNAIDNAAAATKNEIDLISPVGSNIIGDNISFNPTRITISYDAGGVQATAESWRDTIQTNLTAQTRTYKTKSFVGRRENDPERLIIVVSDLATHRITNF